jgi:hypothetical protein
MTGCVVERDRLANGEATPAQALAPQDLPALFHRLNNQLGVILANAELLETRLSSPPERARAAQVVAGALDAIQTIQDLRRLLGGGSDRALDTVLNPSAD